MGAYDPKSNWFLTYPKNDASVETLLKALSDKFHLLEYLIARELHADGDPHLHAYVKLTDGVKLKDAPDAFNVLDKSGNYQPCRSAKSVIKYVTKGGDYKASFDVDSYLNKKGKVNSEILRKYTGIQALDAELIHVSSLKAYEYARSLAVLPSNRNNVCGIWIHGPPGVGKSRIVRDLISPNDLFFKQQNKWWDGYSGEKYVILDDLDKEFCSWHGLKLWTDRYAITGEVKGGKVSLAYDWFIVTSNYTIEELLKKKKRKFDDDDEEGDEQLLGALKRRFKEYYLQDTNVYKNIKKKLRQWMQIPVAPEDEQATSVANE